MPIERRGALILDQAVMVSFERQSVASIPPPQISANYDCLRRLSGVTKSALES